MQPATVKKYADLLWEAKIAYYLSGNTIMSDHEYDILEKVVKANCPNHPYLEMVGHPGDAKKLTLKQTTQLLKVHNESKHQKTT